MILEDDQFVYLQLLHEYFSIGATGRSAITALWDDIVNERFTENISEWNITENVMYEAACYLCIDILKHKDLLDTINIGSNATEIWGRVSGERLGGRVHQ